MARGTNGAKANILVVDDNDGQRMALCSILGDLDVNLVEAGSGREALRCLLQNEFAVILLDVNMPGLDGFETASLVRERLSSERTPIIFVTAFGDDTYVDKGYSLGAVDYITAPVQPSMLRAKVSVFIDLYRKTEEVRRQSDELRRYASQLQQLTQASLAINSARSVEEVLQVMAENACAIIGAGQSSATGALADKFKQVTVTHAARGPDVPPESFVTLPGRRPFVQAPRRFTRADLQRDPSRAEVAHVVPDAPLEGWLAAPLTARGGDVTGDIQLSEKLEGDFTREDESIIVQLAQMGAVAIENTHAAEAREANRMKDEFLGVLSHELRTPLQAMLTWIAILRRDSLDPQTLARGLDVIDRGVRTQVQLIADLLDVSRIVRGQIQIESAPVDVVKVVDLAVETLRPAATAKRIDLHRRAESDGWVLGDAPRLQQIVSNLITNAIKFTPPGGRVEVALSDAGDQLCIQVRDTGTGISPEFLPHVFERFRQSESGTDRRHGGLGLGLAIVHHLVEVHGGTVRAENIPASGALFTVLLPRHSPPQETVIESIEAANGTRLDGIRVLLVEDEVDTRESLTTALQLLGAHVVAVTSAAAARDFFDRHKPDVLLSDVGMAGEDGYSLIRDIRARESLNGHHVPAAAVTAHVRAEDRVGAIRAGFDTHLQKPIETAELAQVVWRLARRL